jgi:hypothetical protein
MACTGVHDGGGIATERTWPGYSIGDVHRLRSERGDAAVGGRSSLDIDAPAIRTKGLVLDTHKFTAENRPSGQNGTMAPHGFVRFGGSSILARGYSYDQGLAALYTENDRFFRKKDEDIKYGYSLPAHQLRDRLRACSQMLKCGSVEGWADLVDVALV